MVDVFPAERRGRATGTLMLAFALASVAGAPVDITLANRLGWQVPGVHKAPSPGGVGAVPAP